MDNNLDFDSVSQTLGLFLEGQNALDATQPNLTCENFCANFMHPFCAQSTVNYDWSQSLNEVNITLEDKLQLDSNSRIPPPNTQDEVAAHTKEWTTDFSKWSLMPSAFGRKFGQGLVCHYHDCTSTSFRTMCDLKMHLKGHLHELLGHWIESHTQPCTWPGCTSRAKFKSKKAFQTHLENIHIDPLLCPEKGCPYRDPFRNNYDLKRHVKTIHHGEDECQFQCPFPKCCSYPRTFVRRDKWLNHLRSGHGDSICPLNHCEATSIGMKTNLVEHIKNSHGNFECGIGSCHHESPSRFSKFGLMKHLEFHHEMQHKDIDMAQSIANQASDRTVRLKGLPRETIWRDCRLCIGKNVTREWENEGQESFHLDCRGGLQIR